MERSGVLLTRRIADEDMWNEAALERRAEDLADRSLSLWHWSDPEADAPWVPSRYVADALAHRGRRLARRECGQ